MLKFSLYDTRNYPTLPVREGYTAWAPTYEATVLDLMDLRLAERLETVAWTEAREALDLACGTGRIGVWLRGKGVAAVDGVDITPAMLEQAHDRGVYRELMLGDVASVPRPADSYDLLVQSLADEHLADLRPLYGEAARLTRPGGTFVLVGYHPWFLMTGMPTHFDPAPGRSVAIESYVHLFADHVGAARRAGLRLDEMQEALIDDAWVEAKPKWAVHLNRPISFVFVWRR